MYRRSDFTPRLVTVSILFNREDEEDDHDIRKFPIVEEVSTRVLAKLVQGNYF